MRCRLGKTKINQLKKKTGLPIITAFTRGGTDHKIDLCLDDGSIMCLLKNGTIEKSDIGWDIKGWDESHNKSVNKKLDDKIEKLNSSISGLKYEYGNLNDAAKSLTYRINELKSMQSGPFPKTNYTCEDDTEIEKEVIKAYNKKPFCPHCGQLITKETADNYRKILHNIIVEYGARGQKILDRIAKKNDVRIKLKLIENRKKDKKRE